MMQSPNISSNVTLSAELLWPPQASNICPFIKEVFHRHTTLIAHTSESAVNNLITADGDKDVIRASCRAVMFSCDGCGYKGEINCAIFWINR